MSVIKVNCIDQALSFENTPVIASGSREDYVSFTFCQLWGGHTKTAVFWRNEADAYHVMLDRDNTCKLPPEVTGDEGVVYFGVFGVDGLGRQRTSNVLTYRIEKGAITVASAPSDPTPDFYTQLLAMERAFETHIEQLVVNGLVPDNTLTTEKMKNGIVTTAKIADGAVTTQKMADGGVTTEKLADKSVAAEKLADKSVTAEKLAASAVTHVLSKGLQTVVGSYMGDGTYGADHPRTLNFAFTPLLVIITTDSDFESSSGILFIYGQEQSNGFGVDDGGVGGMNLNLSWSEKSVSWYTTSVTNVAANRQMNRADMIYHYFAIGVNS